MTVSAEVLRELARSKQEMLKVLDSATSAQARAWARAWIALEPGLYASLQELASSAPSARALRRSRALTGQLKALQETLSTLVGNANVVATQSLSQFMTMAVDAQIAMMNPQLRGYVTATRPDPAQLREIVKRSTQAIGARSRPLVGEVHTLITNSLTRGVAEGDNPKVIARAMVNEAKGQFDLGFHRSVVISRTEVLDAYRNAGQATQKANEELLDGWQWIATLTPRTCPSCIAQHGRKHPLSEGGPHDHPLGRCSRVPLVRSLRSLGIDADDPPDNVPNAKDWFEGLSPKEKLSVLGPARMKAYDAGKYPMDKWSTKRENKGWRPSYVVSKPPRH